MTATGNTTRRMRRFTCGLGAAVLGSGAMAAGASAASLKLTVPGQVAKGKPYNVGIAGSYQKSELKGKAFLISLIQFSSNRCKGSAQEENDWANRTNTLIQFYFAPKSDPSKGSVGVFETKSPFQRTDGFKAGDVGTRHVCTYLYPKSIHPGDRTKPIAKADKKYKVTRH